LKKFEYLNYARGVSYAMQGKSAAESTGSWMREQLERAGVGGKSKPPRVQSFLGGAFLRMYLDGAADPVIISMAGNEIAASPEFKRLSGELNRFLQSSVDRSPQAAADTERLRVLADKHLKAIKTRSGIAFRYTLNAVIGGVTGVDVRAVTLVSESAARSGSSRQYRFDITFSDTYDFENQRYGEYDRYRKELARYLLRNDFERFWAVYSREAHHPLDKTIHRTHLDNAAVFASFMYALEQKKWTPGGLKWDVTVPAEITLAIKPSGDVKADAARHH
jgi:hypothetical protein